MIPKEKIIEMANYGFKKICPTCTKKTPNIIRFSKVCCENCYLKKSKLLFKKIKINNL